MCHMSCMPITSTLSCRQEGNDVYKKISVNFLHNIYIQYLCLEQINLGRWVYHSIASKNLLSQQHVTMPTRHKIQLSPCYIGLCLGVSNTFIKNGLRQRP